MRIDGLAMRRVAQGWLLLVGLGLAMLVWLSVTAALRAMAAHRALPEDAAGIATGYETDEHFPGAALLLAAVGAMKAGATGTAALPALPVPAEVAEALVKAEPAGVVTPALPFAASRIGAIDRGRALECLTAAIYYEAGAEAEAGQEAVAQVVLNRVRHPAFPATVCGVVYQGSENIGCQFSFACDGAMRRAPSRAGWLRAGRIAAAALGGRVYAPVGLATHYHSYAVTPAWNRSLVMTDMVGAHLFHRWKGYWGTAAAFRQVYSGSEPMPGPHPPPPFAPVVPVDTAAVPKTVVTSGNDTALVPATAPESRLPPASAVLPKWRDAGTVR